MIIVYVILFLVVMTGIGKIVNTRGGTGRGYLPRRFGMGAGRSAVDREENPRDGDDGSSYGYRPGD
jgi:hypothetical protein